MLLRLMVLMLACCAAAAQEKASVSGRVVNAQTGEPIRKAMLLLRGISVSPTPAESYSAISDASGAFVLPDLEPGSYRLHAERTGFVPLEYGSRGSNRSGTAIRLGQGQQLAGLDLRLTPQAVIAGRILDEDGDPAEGAVVTVMRYTHIGGRRQLAAAQSATTDDQGDYRLHGLQPGKYYLTVTARWAGVPTGVRAATEDNYAPTFYPGTVDPAAAVIVNATAGAVLRGMDMTLAKVRTVRVTGKVVDPSGQPLGRNISIFAAREGGADPFHGRSATSPPAADGQFVLRGLRPGAYMLGAERWQDNRRDSARQEVTVGEDGAENVILTLTPPLDLQGRIRVEGSPDAKITGINLMLQARGDYSRANASGARLQPDGSFTMQNVAPDWYDVTVLGVPQTMYVKSVRWGNDDALTSGLNLLHGGGGMLDILLSPTAAAVDVSVMDAKQQPAAGAMVVAVPDGPRAALMQFYKAGAADAQGHAALRGLAPGDYKLYAWEDVELNAWLDPEFMQQYEKQAESLSLAEKARESKQLTLIPASN